MADAVLDRLVHGAYRFDLRGDSQRKLRSTPPASSGLGDSRGVAALRPNMRKPPATPKADSHTLVGFPTGGAWT